MEKEKLNITDLEKLKITKVKGWAIYFDYDKKHYLLHGSSPDYEHFITLYERILNENGRYNLNIMDSKASDSDYIVGDYIKKYKKSKPYKYIDKEYFVKKLSYEDFAKSIYDEKVRKCKERIKEYNYQIKTMNNIISDIRSRICELQENF